jgi:hypothetical protein
VTERAGCNQHTEKNICRSGVPTKETSTSEIVVLRSKNHCFSVLFHEIPPSFSMTFLSTASADAQDGISQYSR